MSGAMDGIYGTVSVVALQAHFSPVVQMNRIRLFTKVETPHMVVSEKEASPGEPTKLIFSVLHTSV
jgi:hypothetical protein